MLIAGTNKTCATKRSSIGSTSSSKCIDLKNHKKKSRSANTMPTQQTFIDRHIQRTVKVKQSMSIKTILADNQPIIHSMLPKLQHDNPYFIQTLKVLKRRRNSHLLIEERSLNHLKHPNTSLSIDKCWNILQQCRKKRKQYLTQAKKLKKSSPLIKMGQNRQISKNDLLPWMRNSQAKQQKQKETQQKIVKPSQSERKVCQLRINRRKQINQAYHGGVKMKRKSQPSLQKSRTRQQQKQVKKQVKNKPCQQFFLINKIDLLEPFKIDTQEFRLIKIYNEKLKQLKIAPSQRTFKKEVDKKVIEIKNPIKLKLDSNFRKNKKYFPHFNTNQGKGVSPWHSFTQNFMQTLL